MVISKKVLPIIVFSQFCCASLWFASNAVIGSLIHDFDLPSSALGHLTTALQVGFIVGTLSFSFLSIADRFSPSKVFFVCALIGAAINFGMFFNGNTLISFIALRFSIGFFLAGIYPVGMKIAADYYDKNLNKSLGYLVGALVLGTAFPHVLNNYFNDLSWQSVITFISIISVLGGFLILLFIPDGPHRKEGQKIQLGAVKEIFKNHELKTAAFGYFGHMWELYAFWTFVPIMLTWYTQSYKIDLNIALWSFIIIGFGSVGSTLGAYVSNTLGVKKTATLALLLSFACCLLFPLVFQLDQATVFLGFLVFWGWVVIADSPLFSTLVAQNANPETKGTALTLVNCIGFSTTIASIQLISFFTLQSQNPFIFCLLAIGPLVGLIYLRLAKQIQ